MTKKGLLSRRLSTFGQYSGAIVLGLAAALAIYSNLPLPTATVLVPLSPMFDPPSPEVQSSTLNASLVQWGTQQSYTGFGPPGLLLHVESPSIVAGWTLEGWVNATSPPPIKICASDSIHYDRYDWVYQADRSGSNGKGSFISTPSTVVQRQSTGGDQCISRFAATGVYIVTVCVEGPNLDGSSEGPLGLYRRDGIWHFDTWDRCVEKEVRV